ncbi:GATA zinc finger protein [Perilla frutescens var. hirtella]|nr:GATA zinc finger protein [Perilla frutescens var. hirtella]KAH6810758.1 GATA zinc finger protein [Perilla frutescens var. frutescens]
MWDLANKCYTDFTDYKKCNKQFSDMADLNFLMSKAIENPSLTTSSSLRTSLVTVFEDTVIDDSDHMQQTISSEDYMGCASVHGVGPSIAIFDTVRSGQLDCACIYTVPLHSRKQMSKLVNRMTRVLIDGVEL